MVLQKRKHPRLSEYDYSQNGAYFITICVKNKRRILWNSNVGAPIGRPQLSDIGIIVEKALLNIPNIYNDILIDKYVIMPNHIHMIIVINNIGGRAMRAPTISTIINQFKGYVTKQINHSIWQKLFYDHIIRNEQDYQATWQYIETNSLKWEEDKYY